MSTLPIGDYALLSDCRSAALVGRDGSADWLCFRRFDGPSVFARLLDDDAGHLSVRPAGEFAATRRYLDQTMALATTFTTATGVAVLTDALAVGRNDRGHALGAGSPGVLVLSAPVAPAVDGATASARFTLRAGESAGFALAHASSGEPRDFLYSKLMCWVALDRAIALAGPLAAGDRVEGWTATREAIRTAICERGWSERAGAYTQAFGADDLDASSLMLAITGFLPGDDPRMKATIDATAERLGDERGLVYRYRAADGLEGDEGTFLLCTFWLAQALALAGEVTAARATFERAAAYANDVGLLAEEVDVGGAEMIGNYPQAFSHIGLVNAAWAIAQAGSR
jgi:GH15 family glucan-1,4-alpha-glucosidase